MSLRAQLVSYGQARASLDRHRRAALHRRLLPELQTALGDADAERAAAWADSAGLAATRAALDLLDDVAASSIGDPPPWTLALAPLLRTALTQLSAASFTVLGLLVDPAGAARAEEVLVSLRGTPGRGSVTAAGSCDEAADAAARAAVVAACATLRAAGYAAEPADLEVTWQVPGAEAKIVGPSLGLALGLAVIARGIGRPLPAGIAVTGAVDVDGRVRSVAGTRLKGHAAAAAGAGRLLLPAADAADADGLELAPIATLEGAVTLLWPALRPSRPSRLVPLAAAAALVLLLLGLLEIPALITSPMAVSPRAEATLSDRVVLVTWDRTNGSADAPVRGVDFEAMPDHKSHRATHPTVIRNLADAGARVIAFDAWFRGGDPNALAALERSLAAARAAGTAIVLPARRSAGRWDAPEQTLVDAATAVGSADVVRERPGNLIRRARLGRRDPVAGAPAWSVAALAVALSRDAAPAWSGPDLVTLGDAPQDAPGGERWIAWPERPGFRRYSYADVFGGSFDRAHFDGAIVLVGGTLGSQDRHRTPVGEWFGVEIGAALIDTLLGDHTVRPATRTERTLLLGVMLLTLLGVSALSPRRRLIAALACAGVLAGATLLLARWASAQGVVLPVSDVWIGVALVVAAVVLEERARGRQLAG